jgi:hypothetical protein
MSDVAALQAHVLAAEHFSALDLVNNAGIAQDELFEITRRCDKMRGQSAQRFLCDARGRAHYDRARHAPSGSSA